MNPNIDVITLGVRDLESMRQFCEAGLGYRVEDDRGDLVTLGLGAASSTLALRPWDALAGEAGVAAESSGFRGFTLSYIVDEAAHVDGVLGRVERAGGKISKPPQRAFWGYSAHVTDPSGHLWKIASPKRRPLIRRKGPSTPSEARETTVTIGVADMKRAKQFYKDGLGCSTKKDYAKFVSFDGGDEVSDLAMYQWNALADDAGVPPDGSGFRGFALSHVADSAERADALLDAARRAGGTAVQNGYFTDPDGFLWKIASR